MIVSLTSGAIIGVIAVGACYGIARVIEYAVAEPFHDLGDRDSYGDWPAVPTALSSFHADGPSR
jgi:hypothetical protein